MVLYHVNGRVVKAHEDYLETEAMKDARTSGYRNQSSIPKKRDPNEESERKRVYFVVRQQEWFTLYTKNYATFWEYMPKFDEPKSERFPHDGLDRATLMRCSSHANDYFRREPDAENLEMPIEYPEKHRYWGPELTLAEQKEGILKYVQRDDNDMAHIRPAEIRDYIVPWLQKMEKFFGSEKSGKRKAKSPDNKPDQDDDTNGHYPVGDIPKVELPDALVEQIHLYNVMLQLGLPRFVQQPLIDVLVAGMYQRNLKDCELETLEMTVGRFYSEGVAVLDPVLCHFIGTYPLRTLADRQDPAPADANKPAKSKTGPKKYPTQPNKRGQEHLWDVDRPVDFTQTDRRYLEYATFLGHRKDFPRDTVVLPPKLPILGHSIRHWSGIRRNGSTAAAHNGLPLDVGRVLKYYRRRPSHRIHPKPRNGGSNNHGKDKGTGKDTSEPKDKTDNNPYADDVITRHYVEYSTHRLSRLPLFRNQGPGARAPKPTETGVIEEGSSDDSE